MWKTVEEKEDGVGDKGLIYGFFLRLKSIYDTMMSSLYHLNIVSAMTMPKYLSKNMFELSGGMKWNISK